mmetsp:Transcript_15599/g.18773  ORF Transcript_15599/g.18773 Transcript_15599/m.18773 type:complete len:85 (+) Transcript_15599:76-330(+)
MPKNKLGGNKAKRAKASTENNKKELEFKEAGQEYGQITRMLGSPVRWLRPPLASAVRCCLHPHLQPRRTPRHHRWSRRLRCPSH